MADPNYSDELWRDIPGYEGYYQASSEGRIRSVARVVPATRNGLLATRISPAKVLTAHLNTPRGGYYYVKLSTENKPITKAVHSLVCAAFHGSRPDGMTAAHNNGVSTDNRSENLRWATLRDNHSDKVTHGTLLVGADNGSAKLTENQARAIKFSEENKHVLAERFGVSEAAIRLIRDGKRWKHVEK